MSNKIHATLTQLAQDVADQLTKGQPAILAMAFREPIEKCYLDVFALQRSGAITVEKMMACAIEAAQTMAGSQPRALHLAYETSIAEKFDDVVRLAKSLA